MLYTFHKGRDSADACVCYELRERGVAYRLVGGSGCEGGEDEMAPPGHTREYGPSCLKV